MKKHKYNNTVIQSKGGEHGKRVIEWWREQGVDVKGFIGDYQGGFYGLKKGVFDFWRTLPSKATIIELPESNPQKNVHRIFGFIYITNDEEIEIGDWVINLKSLHAHKELCKIDNQLELEKYAKKTGNNCKKIILTTDPKLIKDGVEAIDDEFLEWIVKNSSCEGVEVNKYHQRGDISGKWHYKIIIPKEEPKQATNPQDLIGRKVRGFKFEDKTTPVYFTKNMEAYIGKVGQIIEPRGGHVTVEFDDNTFVYPLSLIHEHLVEEDINVDTSPQIIDLSNVEGVEMMVGNWSTNWRVKKVVAKISDKFMSNDGYIWLFAKPIEVKQVTMQEVEQMFGCRVEIVKED